MRGKTQSEGTQQANGEMRGISGAKCVFPPLSAGEAVRKGRMSQPPSKWAVKSTTKG